MQNPISFGIQDVKNFENFEYLVKQAVEGYATGLHKSPYHGFSVEFAEHQLYNVGESTKHIDWRVFSRTDKLYIKKYEEETNLRAMILIDTSGSMYYPKEGLDKVTFSVFAAGCLAYILNKQRDATGLCLFDNDIQYLGPIKSSGLQFRKMLLKMNETIQTPPIQANTQTNIATTLHLIAEQIPHRSLIILFSDMFDDVNQFETIFAALLHLKHYKHEVLIFHVTDKNTELDLEFPNRSFVFEDIESGKKIKLNPTQYKDKFKELQEEKYIEMKLRCAQAKIDFVEADLREGYTHVLHTFLVKKSK